MADSIIGISIITMYRDSTYGGMDCGGIFILL